MKQIDYLMKVYPHDKNILNFTILGNHDYSVLQHSGQNLEIALQSYRHDIIPIGYETGKINIKNSSIYLNHPIEQNKNKTNFEQQKNSILLKGHSHKMKVQLQQRYYNISVPSLSDIIYNGNNIMPTFLKLETKFENGIFKKAKIYQLLLADKIYLLNEFMIDFDNEDHEYDNKEIKNEEHAKKIIKYTPDMSQIENLTQNINYKNP